jgi:hypothetical protein
LSPLSQHGPFQIHDGIGPPALCQVKCKVVKQEGVGLTSKLQATVRPPDRVDRRTGSSG